MTAISDLSLTVEKGSFTALLGPSGCGKSTLLRMIAGLEAITAGQCFIDGVDVTDMPPAKRRIAMVFQSYALYPHMTVRQNIAFSLSIAGASRKVQDERALEVARILQLEPYLDRRPAELSGGQRQRVAIGRALVRKPEVFLFDEPLSNLDAKLRVQMRLELAKLHADLGTTMIYVTHDQTEAMTLADKIVVLDRGTISQVGIAARSLQPPRQQVRRRLHRLAEHEFLRGRASPPSKAARRRVALPGGRAARVGVRAKPARRRGPVELGVRPEHLGDRRARRPGAALTGAVAIVERLGNATIPLCRHAGRSAHRRGRRESRGQSAATTVGLRLERAARAAVRRRRRGALIGARTRCGLRARS